MKLEEKTRQNGASGVAAPDYRGETETTTALSKDAIFEILRSSRRRSALRWLAEWDGRGTTRKLAEHIAAEEKDITVRELASKQRKTVYISLYQGHLPKLADYGVVTYNRSRGTVELTEMADVLFPYLELDQEQSTDRPPDGRRSVATIIRRWLMSWR